MADAAPDAPGATSTRDLTDAVCDAVRRAAAEGRPLVVRGGDTKAFYGREPTGEVLELETHRGIVEYEPTELVITARAGTTLDELEAVLADRGQILGFEPPRFGKQATIGGTLACGFSGPRRPYAGAARDFVLGTRVVNGLGQPLRFGGKVIKNVAGYDVSRLMVGALGVLGVIMEVSLKILPADAREETCRWEVDAYEAIRRMNEWARMPLPISGTCFADGVLYARWSGARSAVAAAINRYGGSKLENGPRFWTAMKEHETPFFGGTAPLWRLSVPAATPPLELAGDWLIEWSGAQRWLRAREPDDVVRDAAAKARGHATRFRSDGRRTDVFHPLTPALLALHKRLKQAFDPKNILNRGRLYADL
jgi:glycolate oxidase FAD binding subunit